MDEIIRYIGVMTLGTFSIPLAVGLAWLTLRGIFDLMPHRAGTRPAMTKLAAAPVIARRS